MRLSVADAARMAGKSLPRTVPAKCFCPIRKHKRSDKTFRIFRAADGTEMWKCWSCDEPENAGDGLKLYCLITGDSRKDAFKAFVDRGFEFGAGSQRWQERSSWEATRAPRRFVEPVRAASDILPLPVSALADWKKNDMAAVNEYMRRRGFQDQDWQQWGLISLGGDYLGFVYRDPDSGFACRVKVRGMNVKRFWNEPRPDPKRPGAKAKAPLWMAEHLMEGESVVIVEGEMDALSLAVAGIENVVSLPDGSESASTVDLRILRELFPTWIVATDDDEPGERAWQTLKQRAAGTGNVAVRRKFWSGETNFKDANEALQSGFRKEDFARCLFDIPADTRGAA